MTELSGKGIFIWQAGNSEGGDVSRIVAACQSMGLQWVAVKCGNGANPAFQSFVDMAAAVGAFHSAGMGVWLWHYVLCGWYYNRTTHEYQSVPGSNPEADAAFARDAMRRLGADGLILDAEAEFKNKSQRDRAKRFVRALGVGKPVALSSYRFPTLHPEFPWNEFLAGCHYHMPQVYWQPPGASQGPVIELDRSILELNAKRSLPVAPIGRAYIGDGHPDPKPGEISAFADRARQQGCPAISFWSLDHLYLHKGGQARGEAIANAWGGSTPPPPPEPETAPRPTSKLRVTGKIVNLRSGAGVSFADVGDVAKNVELYGFEECGPWVRISPNAWIKTGAGLADWVTRY